MVLFGIFLVSFWCLFGSFRSFSVLFGSFRSFLVFIATGGEIESVWGICVGGLLGEENGWDRDAAWLCILSGPTQLNNIQPGQGKSGPGAVWLLGKKVRLGF